MRVRVYARARVRLYVLFCDVYTILKGMILNKLLQSSTSQPSKMTIVPTSSAVKSPTKILPAPTTNIQAKSSSTTNQQSTFISSKSSTQQSPQKVIIRQVGQVVSNQII